MIRLLGAALLMALCAAGCNQSIDRTRGTQGAESTDSAPTVSPIAVPSVSEPAAPLVRIGLTEWTITYPVDPIPAGPITLIVTNTGATEHDLEVEGRAGHWRTPLLAPGQQTRLPVITVAGEQLRFLCDVAGHQAAGMHVAAAVAAATANRP